MLPSEMMLSSALLVGSLCLLASAPGAQGCGPGRGGMRRSMLRKYPPVVLRQYIPNVSENTLGASGKPEGPIRRRDRRFKELVQNRNPDIEFKDQERTGADRMMSQRLKEKLSTLAISVMNQWPNVKLRVIEGWDEDNKHAVNSLHYEGRAVDITTSDRDKAKYGMLARLAVEAGFDWVHYEARSHVHCSVKSEKADSIRNNGCFDGASLVVTPAGSMHMSQLQTNDLVLAMDSRTGRLHFSPVIMWLDRDELANELYVEIATKSNRLIRLTASHLLYVTDQQQLSLNDQAAAYLANSTSSGGGVGADDKVYYNFINQTDGEANKSAPGAEQADEVAREPLLLEEVAYTTYAHNVVVGQYLLIDKAPTSARRHQNDATSGGDARDEDASGKPRRGSRLQFEEGRLVEENVQDKSGVLLDQIVSVNYVTRKGIYAPLTREGNIVVNSVVASCYAVISEHELAHMSFAPVRWLSYMSELLFGLKPATPTSERTVAALATRRLSSQPPTTLQDSGATSRTGHRKRNSSGGRNIHWYPAALYRIARIILPTKYLY